MLRFLLSLRRGNTSDWWRKKEETSRDLAHHQGPSCLVLYFQRPPTLPLAPAFLLLQCKRKEKHVNMMEAVRLCDHCALLTLRLSLLTCWAHLPLCSVHILRKVLLILCKEIPPQALSERPGCACLKEVDPSIFLHYQDRSPGGFKTK